MGKLNSVLAINDGHNASVALAIDGVIVFAISEERILRKKNYWGWPAGSIEAAKHFAGVDRFDSYGIYRDNTGDFAVFLWARSLDSRRPHILLRGTVALAKFCVRFVGPFLLRPIGYLVPKRFMRNYYANRLSVDSHDIYLVNHHIAHSHCVNNFFRPAKNQSSLVISLDGEGDLLSGMISVANGNSKNLDVLASFSRENSLGYFYLKITRLLAMKGNEHEFKVMGLAGYVDPAIARKNHAYREIRSWFRIENGSIKSRFATTSVFFRAHLEIALRGVRFDMIAAVAQAIIEDILVELVEYWVERTGVKSVVLTGGLMMNIRACKKISEVPLVERVSVVPSSGDETTVLGVLDVVNEKRFGKNLQQLSTMYLGRSIDQNALHQFLEQSGYKWKKLDQDSLNSTIAKMLADGSIVARCSGREEFGARALGNRSILARPDQLSNLSLINKKIKMRDFWMPFTPTILDICADDYLKKNKFIHHHFMSTSVDSTELGAMNLAAAIHPFDHTVRPQILRKEANPEYYELILAFYRLTGIGGLLNTSFNLHGYPNVGTWVEALSVFDQSGVDVLVIEDVVLAKDTAFEHIGS